MPLCPGNQDPLLLFGAGGGRARNLHWSGNAFTQSLCKQSSRPQLVQMPFDSCYVYFLLQGSSIHSRATNERYTRDTFRGASTSSAKRLLNIGVPSAQQCEIPILESKLLSIINTPLCRSEIPKIHNHSLLVDPLRRRRPSHR